MGILEKEIKKVFAAVVLAIVSVIMSGCVYADNKSWGDMTYEEKQEVKQEYAEIKEELEEEFSGDSIEDGLASYILDAAGAVIENAD